MCSSTSEEKEMLWSIITGTCVLPQDSSLAVTINNFVKRKKLLVQKTKVKNYQIPKIYLPLILCSTTKQFFPH